MSSGSDKGGKDDGVVTSAPAASVGSLLSDLLSEAKRDVAEQRQELEDQIKSKHAEERENQAREEARRREAMQRKLVEETRLRNQALARKQREAERAMGETEVRAEPEPEIAPIVRAAPEAPKGRTVPGWMLAALVLVGVGVGVGSSFALTPSPRLNIPDVEAAARTTVAQTIRSAGAEYRINADLRAANDKIATLTKDLEAAEAARTKLVQDLKKASNDLELTKAELAAAQAAATKRPRRPRGRTGGGLKIDTSVFK